MANRNAAGFGLIPTRVLGQGPATAGFGQYWIDNADSTAIYNGEAVYSAAGSITGAQGSATTVTLGVLQGIFYNAATTIKPTWSNYFAGGITPANSEDIQAFVYDNPFQIYRCGTDDAVAASIAAAHVKFMETFSVYANTGGNTTTGNSTATLDIAATNATTHSWRLLRSAEDPENNDLTAAYCTLEVVQNLSEFVGTGT